MFPFMLSLMKKGSWENKPSNIDFFTLKVRIMTMLNLIGFLQGLNCPPKTL